MKDKSFQRTYLLWVSIMIINAGWASQEFWFMLVTMVLSGAILYLRGVKPRDVE